MKELAQEAAIAGRREGRNAGGRSWAASACILNVLNIFIIILNLLGFVSND